MFELTGAVVGTLPLSAVKAGGGFSERLTARLAENYQRSVFESQGRGCDPYGAAWQKTKRGNRPLHGSTGALLAGTRVVPSGKNVRVLNNIPYAIYHQSGGAKLAQRKIVPDVGWPVNWEPQAQKIAVQYLKSLLK